MSDVRKLMLTMCCRVRGWNNRVYIREALTVSLLRIRDSWLLAAGFNLGVGAGVK